MASPEDADEQSGMKGTDGEEEGMGIELPEDFDMSWLARVLREDNVSWPLLIEMFWFGLFGASPHLFAHNLVEHATLLAGAIPIAFVEAGVAYMTVRHWQATTCLVQLLSHPIRAYGRATKMHGRCWPSRRSTHF